ncbi:MAG: hypothetical protein ACI87E_003316, partial [Mariniblastus sp.]
DQMTKLAQVAGSQPTDFRKFMVGRPGIGGS